MRVGGDFSGWSDVGAPALAAAAGGFWEGIVSALAADGRYERAKARMAWALNVATKGTPMMFMGGECHQDGYWHDGADAEGEHRFNWSIAGASA